MSFLTLDSANVTHQNVLVRLDLNLPMQNGQVTDDTRIKRSLSTLQELLKKDAKVIILSHFGRPKGKTEPALSLEPIAKYLQKFVDCPISFATDCIGTEAQGVIQAAPFGSIVVLENLRFHPEEEANDAEFAKKLAALGNLYINDAFSCSHRAHASVTAISKLLPSYAGRAMGAELKALESVLKNPKRPVMAIVGGSKVSTKIDLLHNLIQQVDHLVIGGGMANTFLAAQAHEVGKSLCEDDFIPTAQEIMIEAQDHNCNLIIPIDVAVTDEITESAKATTVSAQRVGESHKIADMGEKSVALIQQTMEQCQTVIWNGPVGVFEISPFDKGSLALAHHIAMLTKQGKLVSVAGGGDTLAALAKANVESDLTYTSTAGGAFLEWLEGKVLPGVEALNQEN